MGDDTELVGQKSFLRFSVEVQGLNVELAEYQMPAARDIKMKCNTSGKTFHRSAYLVSVQCRDPKYDK